MKSIVKTLVFAFMLCAFSFVGAKEAKAFDYNISMTPVTDSQGNVGTGYGYSGQKTYFNIWDETESDEIEEVTLNIYKDDVLYYDESVKIISYTNYANIEFVLYETGEYTDGSTFNRYGSFYIYTDDYSSDYDSSQDQDQDQNQDNDKEEASIISSPDARSVEVGSPTTFTVEATGSGLTYQWWYNNDGSTTSGQKIDGATSSSYTISASDMTAECNGRYYLCTISTDEGEFLRSVPAKLTVYRTITYDANGGTGAPSSQSEECGQYIIISTIKPVRLGYTFLGWSTSSTALTADSDYRIGYGYGGDESVTLYAVWSYNSSYDNSDDYDNSDNSNNSDNSDSSDNYDDYDDYDDSDTDEALKASIYVTNGGKKGLTKTLGTKKFDLNASTDSDGTMTYSSSNSKVATVDKYGTVKIKGYGKATITIKVSATGSYKAVTKKVKLNILPDKVQSFNVKSKKVGRATCTWKKKSISGANCQIQISPSSRFPKPYRVTKHKKNPLLKMGGVKDIDVKKLSKKTVYFRARVVVKKAGKTYKSEWVVKKIRIK